jgi:hypothetical protein
MQKPQENFLPSFFMFCRKERSAFRRGHANTAKTQKKA